MNSSNNLKVSAFNEVDSHSLTKQLTDKIKADIENLAKDYILSIDENEFKTYLTTKYTIEPLVVDFESELVEQPKVTKELIENYLQRGRFQTDVYEFTITYNYSGSPVVFKIRPDRYKMTTADLFINEVRNTVSFKIKLYQQDPALFKRDKDSCFQRAFTNLPNANEVVNDWNQGVAGIIDTHFRFQKNKYQKENDFYTAINVKVNKETSYVFPVPSVKKKIIPKLPVTKTKEIASEPWITKEIYDDILKVIYDSGKNMEKKPALYKGKDEEGLRDQFLFILETRYEGTTATGETFNRSGKTDIILKFAQDSSNLFVAECKFWHGASEYLKAISQLFDKYLTWRDSKAALIIFVKNKEFTNVLTTIETEIKDHPYFVREQGKKGETSFSYIFHLPQDNNKNVYFEVMAFHYDK
jgi:hypothetical protein